MRAEEAADEALRDWRKNGMKNYSCDDACTAEAWDDDLDQEYYEWEERQREESNLSLIHILKDQQLLFETCTTSLPSKYLYQNYDLDLSLIHIYRRRIHDKICERWNGEDSVFWKLQGWAL